MKARGIWFNGDPVTVSGTVIAEHGMGITIRSDQDGTNYPIAWRHVVTDLFHPPELDERIRDDRRKWGLKV